MNGAAFAAFGEMVVDLMLGAVPLVASSDGVKLGDSTLSRFLRLAGSEKEFHIHILGLRTGVRKGPPVCLS